MKAIALVFSSSLLLLLASCGTAPAKITPPPLPQPVSAAPAAPATTGPDAE